METFMHGLWILDVGMSLVYVRLNRNIYVWCCRSVSGIRYTANPRIVQPERRTSPLGPRSPPFVLWRNILGQGRTAESI